MLPKGFEPGQLPQSKRFTAAHETSRAIEPVVEKLMVDMMKPKPPSGMGMRRSASSQKVNAAQEPMKIKPAQVNFSREGSMPSLPVS